jgi:phage-related protein (TIGR01555 family)
VAKPHIRLKAGESVRNAWPTSDSFQNFEARVGIGADNMLGAGTYGYNPISRNRIKVEWTYRGSWIAGKAVDCVAEDMTRAGIEVQSSVEPSQLKAFNKHLSKLQIWAQLQDSEKWARLYGGGAAFLMVAGQDPSTPLKLDRIGRDQFRGVYAFDRWALWPDMSRLVTELGPDLGTPEFYDLVPDANTGMPKLRIHYSRLVRLAGVKLPFWQRIWEMHWGQSVLERLWDRLVSFDSTTLGASQLVYKAHLRTVKIDGLRDLISLGGDAMNGLVKQMDFIRKFQSNEGLTVLDGKDEFETSQYTFSGLDAVLLQLGQQLSGALDIPLVRLFGQSPAGLNSTGESDLRNYYDGINQRQETDLRTGSEKIYECAFRSKFGTAPPEDWDLVFRPLWQMSDEQEAEVTAKTTDSVVSAYEAQIIKRSTALKELKEISQTTGTFSNISDEEIEEAENDPPPSPEALGLELPAPAPLAGPQAKGKPGAAANPAG